MDKSEEVGTGLLNVCLAGGTHANHEPAVPQSLSGGRRSSAVVDWLRRSARADHEAQRDQQARGPPERAGLHGAQLDEETVERLGVATAISCKNKFWDSASERDAIDQLLYKASLAGGTGIADVACESEGTNFAKNCWSSYTCRAAIVRFARTGPPDGRAGTAGSSGTGLAVSAEGHPKIVPGAATPEAVWEKAKDAYRRGDFWTYIESVSPEGHDECICHISFYIGMAGDAGMLATREVTEMNEILRRNGMAELRLESSDAASNEKPGLFGRKAIHRIKDNSTVRESVDR